MYNLIILTADMKIEILSKIEKNSFKVFGVNFFGGFSLMNKIHVFLACISLAIDVLFTLHFVYFDIHGDPVKMIDSILNLMSVTFAFIKVCAMVHQKKKLEKLIRLLENFMEDGIFQFLSILESVIFDYESF